MGGQFIEIFHFTFTTEVDNNHISSSSVEIARTADKGQKTSWWDDCGSQTDGTRLKFQLSRFDYETPSMQHFYYHSPPVLVCIQL